MNRELPDVEPGFKKGRGTRDQIANIHWIIEKAREFQEIIYFCFSDSIKPLIVWITTVCGKFFKRWDYQTTLLLLRNMHAGQEAGVRSRHGKLPGSKMGKEYIKAVYCHPAYLTYMQSTSVKCQAG